MLPQQTSHTTLISSSSSPFSPPNNARKPRQDSARSWCHAALRQQGGTRRPRQSSARGSRQRRGATVGSGDGKFPLGGVKGPILFLTRWRGRCLFLTRRRRWWLFPMWHDSGARWHMAAAQVGRAVARAVVVAFGNFILSGSPREQADPSSRRAHPV
jgi:hypothetical protein